MERKFGDNAGFEYVPDYSDIWGEGLEDKTPESVEKVEQAEQVEAGHEQAQEIGKEVLGAVAAENVEPAEVEPVEKAEPAEIESVEKAEPAVEAEVEKKSLAERRREVREKLLSGARRGVATVLAIASFAVPGGGKKATAEGENLGQETRIEERANYDDDEEEISIEDILEEGYVAPEHERTMVNGAEFITDGTKEIEGIGEVQTFKYVGGHVKENNRFYGEEKRKPYAFGESFEGEDLAQRFEEWEMSLAMQPKALAAAVDQFNLEEELGIPEFESLEDADRWANEVAEMAADDYDATVNRTIARILNKIHGVKTSRECTLARDMRDETESPTESEGEDDVETFGQLRGNKSALQITFVDESGENVCSDPEAFAHIIASLTPAEQAKAKKVGNTAWLNIGEYDEKGKKNGGLAGNWEFKEGKREAKTTPVPETTETPGPQNTETPGPENTETPGPQNTETPGPQTTETPEPQNTETPEPTETPVVTPAPTATPTPTQAPTPTPTQAPTPTPTQAPTPTPTQAPTPTPEPKPTKNPEAIEQHVEQVAEQEHVQQTTESGADTSTQGLTEQPQIVSEATVQEQPASQDELAAQLADLGL